MSQVVEDIRIESTFVYSVIYVFGIDDRNHRGRLKIGETSIAFAQGTEPGGVEPGDEALERAARRRIDSYTRTADIAYDLLWTELGYATRQGEDGEGLPVIIHDHDVHRVLIASGFPRKSVTAKGRKSGEWFEVTLAQAKAAIAAAKEGRATLTGAEAAPGAQPIVLRDEQREAVNLAKRAFEKKKKDTVLWDAKMRFGKTVSALSVAKELGFAHTIIVTHRPVVKEGWYEDFNKVFVDAADGWCFGGKGKYSLEQLQRFERQGTCKHYVYFASMQDLRGAEIAGGKLDKDYDIFENCWDFLVIDEAHEGTQTQLAGNVLELLTTNGHTKTLLLSGTPFNLYDAMGDPSCIYTWDYTAEQKAKENWELTHFSEPNPYRGLPQLRMYTYELADCFRVRYDDIEDKAFNFHEFFRVYAAGDDIPAAWPDASPVPHVEGSRPQVGDFVHEDDVWAFLCLITRRDRQDATLPDAAPDADTNFPFSTPELRSFLRHTLWIVPGVKEARALSSLMHRHPVFMCYHIVNVAGAGDDGAYSDDALGSVFEAIGERPEQTWSVTISCGRLTTGVTVGPWTGVLMLSNMTSPSAYLQTIFRVQSPADIGGMSKERCYAFDFAPDRTLKLVAEASRLRTEAGSVNSAEQREAMAEFLNYCPIIAVDGSKMRSYDVNTMMRHIKRAAAQAAVRNGFDDDSIYNEHLLELTDDDARMFNDLKGIIGKTKAVERVKDLVVNEQGFDEEAYESARVKQREKQQLTAEDKAALEAMKQRRKEREAAISILRGISIRIPMLVYGADVPVDEAITPESFVDLVDGESWEEFMPAGVSKHRFKQFLRFYDADVFVEAGTMIRRRALAADELLPEERIPIIGQIFAGFRNPDKETVLTPWRVVNMQLGDTLGGRVFFEDGAASAYTEPLAGYRADDTPAMRFVEQPGVTERSTACLDTTYLEINAKSGLYALLCAYNSYAAKVDDYLVSAGSISQAQRRGFWNVALQENVFVVCKTPMARAIAQRTLRGFQDNHVNCAYVKDTLGKIRAGTFEHALAEEFGGKVKDMHFDVIIGNPPYQEMGGSGGKNDAPVYQHFVEAAQHLHPGYISLVIPSRWFTGGRENLLAGFRKAMLANDSLRVLYDYTDARDVFPNVEIKGGVCYFLEDANYHGLCEVHLFENGEELVCKRDLNAHETYLRHPMAASIVEKVSTEAGSVESIVSGDTPFGIPSDPTHSKKYPFDVFDVASAAHDVLLFYKTSAGRAKAYVRRADIVKNAADIDRPKALFPKAGWSGNDSHVLGKPIAAPAGSVCSQTFLYAPFDFDEEVEHFLTYYRTRFFRFLVSIFKLTQNAPSRVYRLVPLQDFTSSSDIDWSLPLEEIDTQLFDKYGLTDEERTFILYRIDPFE